MAMREMKRAPGECANGLKAAEVAESGYRVFADILGAMVPWDEADQPRWHTAASLVVDQLSEAVVAEAQVSVPALSSSIAATMGSDFHAQTFEERVAWEAVARHWASLVSSTRVDLQQTEKYSVNWANQKIVKAKPPQNGNGRFLDAAMKTASIKTDPLIENAIKLPDAHDVSKESVQCFGPALYSKQTDVSTFIANERHAVAIEASAANGFRKVIDIKIADYRRKILALEKFQASIGPDADEALADILKDFLKE